MTEPTPALVDEGLAVLINFIDDVLLAQYDEQTVAAIVVEFGLLAPRTVLQMASPSDPEAYKGLREALTEQLRKAADLLSVQEPVDITQQAREEFELLFMKSPSKMTN